MEAPLLATVAGSIVAGLSGSPHCALMCGPLACAGLPNERGPRFRAAAAWHAGRLVAYAGVGAILGGLGHGASHLLSASTQPLVPWLMAAGLIATALDLGRWLKPVPGVAAVARVLGRAGARLSPSLRAGLLGAATPFLPCGLLYGVFLAALAAGSAGWGAGLMASFALGGTAVLAAMQLPAIATWKLSPWVRRSVLLAAAAVLIWRAASAHPAAGGPPACH
ncbi:MAG: Heavy-metal-associated domain protein [Myxococcaceae bacterium]|nr:Heavy-metal-associated domain protein [Myxococcaceae bacterium]